MTVEQTTTFTPDEILALVVECGQCKAEIALRDACPREHDKPAPAWMTWLESEKVRCPVCDKLWWSHSEGVLHVRKLLEHLQSARAVMPETAKLKIQIHSR